MAISPTGETLSWLSSPQTAGGSTDSRASAVGGDATAGGPVAVAVHTSRQPRSTQAATSSQANATVSSSSSTSSSQQPATPQVKRRCQSYSPSITLRKEEELKPLTSIPTKYRIRTPRRGSQRVGLDPHAVLTHPSKTTIRGLGCRASPEVVTPGDLRSLQSYEKGRVTRNRTLPSIVNSRMK